MDKTAIKNFAVWARVQLIEAAKQRAFEYGVIEGQSVRSDPAMVGERVLSQNEIRQRKELFAQIQRKGFSQVMEEAAYTWFNRFLALRYMEINGYLPTKIRVFTNAEGEFKPEILKEALTIRLEGKEQDKVLDLMERQDNEELYKYLLITQCNALNKSLPYMFTSIADWTELLFPANLLKADSVIGRMIADIPEEDWQDAVQIIGWMYQFYNSELKDDTFAQLKKNVKISKERIPAATQLFTPDWIVRYLVENSLGRLWAEGHPEAELTPCWRYYLEEAEQEPEVEAKLQGIRNEYKKLKPEDLKVIDPAMGSGHILVYAFDILMQIYTSAGWSERDAAVSILENNLYGLDIDDRAGQLAYFAVMMKARSYNRRILESAIQPHVYSIQDSSFVSDELITFVAGEDRNLFTDLTYIRTRFRDAKEYGSILDVEPINEEVLHSRIESIQKTAYEKVEELIYQSEATGKLRALIEQAGVMAQKYSVVITNPPYIGSSGMNGKLSEYVKKHYPDSKSDLFAVFMEKWNHMLSQHGFNSMVTMQSWMFLSSFERMRNTILTNRSIVTLMHMDNMVLGIAFGTAAAVFRNSQIAKYKGTYNHIKLNNIIDEKPFEFPIRGNRFSQISVDNFFKIPGSPIAYWASNNVIDLFKHPKLSEMAQPRVGLQTGNNDRFLRYWYEPNNKTVAFTYDKDMTWYPINKGGEYKKWYGNRDYVLFWKNDGTAIRNFFENGKLKSRPQNLGYNFRKAISWSMVTSGNFSSRFFDNNFMFNVAGISVFPSDELLDYLLALLNTKITQLLTGMINPTINMNAGDISRIPVVIDEGNKEYIKELSCNCICSCRIDWDSFETSWDFKKHPLI